MLYEINMPAERLFNETSVAAALWASVTRGCLARQRHASHSEAATVQKAKPMDHRLNLLLCFGRIALP
jgi:hypothetical protein